MDTLNIIFNRKGENKKKKARYDTVSINFNGKWENIRNTVPRNRRISYNLLFCYRYDALALPAVRMVCLLLLLFKVLCQHCALIEVSTHVGVFQTFFG